MFEDYFKVWSYWWPIAPSPYLITCSLIRNFSPMYLNCDLFLPQTFQSLGPYEIHSKLCQTPACISLDCDRWAVLCLNCDRRSMLGNYFALSPLPTRWPGLLLASEWGKLGTRPRAQQTCLTIVLRPHLKDQKWKWHYIMRQERLSLSSGPETYSPTFWWPHRNNMGAYFGMFWWLIS